MNKRVSPAVVLLVQVLCIAGWAMIAFRRAGHRYTILPEGANRWERQDALHYWPFVLGLAICSFVITRRNQPVMRFTGWAGLALTACIIVYVVRVFTATFPPMEYLK